MPVMVSLAWEGEGSGVPGRRGGDTSRSRLRAGKQRKALLCITIPSCTPSESVPHYGCLAIEERFGPDSKDRGSESPGRMPTNTKQAQENKGTLELSTSTLH